MCGKDGNRLCKIDRRSATNGNNSVGFNLFEQVSRDTDGRLIRVAGVSS